MLQPTKYFAVTIFVNLIFSVLALTATSAQTAMQSRVSANTQSAIFSKSGTGTTSKVLRVAALLGMKPNYQTLRPVVVPISSFALEPNVVVLSVKCIRPTDGSDEDDIYVRVDDSTRRGQFYNSFVRKMKAGSVWKPGVGRRISGSGSISLLEQDTFSADDLIGRFSFDDSTRMGRHTLNMQGDGGEYEIVIEISPLKQPSKEQQEQIKKLLQDELIYRQERTARLERELNTCFKKYIRKYPGQNISRTWCKSQYFAFRNDRLAQCRAELGDIDHIRKDEDLNVVCERYLQFSQ
jgi:hypothetical protein